MCTLSDRWCCVPLENLDNLHRPCHFAGLQRCFGIQFGNLGADLLYNYLLGVLFTVFSTTIPHDRMCWSTRICVHFVLWYISSTVNSPGICRFSVHICSINNYWSFMFVYELSLYFCQIFFQVYLFIGLWIYFVYLGN